MGLAPRACKASKRIHFNCRFRGTSFGASLQLLAPLLGEAPGLHEQTSFKVRRRSEMEFTHEGYGAGHPWYYVLGGKRLSLKEIQLSAKASGYRGYRADEIEKADQMMEPRRSESLRSLREIAKQELGQDITRYRELAGQLARRRETGIEDRQNGCDDIHTNISLKHNHIYNELAHILVIDELLSKQGDLFAF